VPLPDFPVLISHVRRADLEMLPTPDLVVGTGDRLVVLAPILIVALVLGWLGRTGSIGWRMPAPANLVLRNLGLTLFLTAVAIGADRPFVEMVASTGIPLPYCPARPCF
jgi:putative transport protein